MIVGKKNFQGLFDLRNFEGTAQQTFGKLLINYLLKVVTPADRGLVACLTSFGGATMVSRCKLATENAGTIRLPPDV